MTFPDLIASREGETGVEAMTSGLRNQLLGPLTRTGAPCTSRGGAVPRPSRHEPEEL